MLAQVLVAAVVGSIVSLGLATYMTSLQRESALTGAKISALGLVNDLRVELQTPDGCRNTLGTTLQLPANLLTQPTAKQNLPQLQLGSIPVLAGADIPAYKVRVNNIELTGLQPRGQTAEGLQLFTADLKIRMSSELRQNGDTAEAARDFAEMRIARPMLVLDNNRTVVKCFNEDSAQGLLEQTCRMQGGQIIANSNPIQCDNLGILEQTCLAQGGVFDRANRSCFPLRAIRDNCTAQGGTFDEQTRKCDGLASFGKSCGPNPLAPNPAHKKAAIPVCGAYKPKSGTIPATVSGWNLTCPDGYRLYWDLHKRQVSYGLNGNSSGGAFGGGSNNNQDAFCYPTSQSLHDSMCTAAAEKYSSHGTIYTCRDGEWIQRSYYEPPQQSGTGGTDRGPGASYDMGY